MNVTEPTRHFILGTAGHVNHGKSALVRALTGINPDRLPEEKARGITIDLGFAELKLGSVRVGIIDVPGHEDFVRNMVAGVGSIDAALLVVASDDGWMPQTEEHLQILGYLGIRAAVVALTKIDLAVDENNAIAAVRERLAGTAFSEAPIISTSVVSGKGIEQIRDAIAGMLAGMPAPRDYGKPRLAADRVFSLKGIGTVATGTLVGGRLARGRHLTLQPSAGQAHIRSMQNHGREVASAGPGSRVALNLPELWLPDSGVAASDQIVRRGDVLTTSSGRPTRRIAAQLWRASRPGLNDGGRRIVRDGAVVRFHHGTSAVRARVRFFDGANLDSGKAFVAVIRLDTPLLIFARDRFVLRSLTERQTIAGGIVLDATARPMNRRRPRYRELLLQLSHQIDQGLAHLQTALARDQVIARDRLLAEIDFSEDEIQELVRQAVKSRMAIVTGPLVVEPSLWDQIRRSARAIILGHHQAHPESAGLPVSELRAYIARDFKLQFRKRFAAPVADGIVSELCAGEFRGANGVIRHGSHQPALPPRLQKPGNMLRERLTRDGLNPPSRAQLCPSDGLQQALRFMVANGMAVELTRDVVVSVEAYEQAVSSVRSHLASRGAATVSELKVLLGSSRRIMVPLLERLDREGITRRDGDLRRLRDSVPAL
jgi:selenocysteine-specific elongation factor